MSVAIYDATWGALTIKQCTSVDFGPNNEVMEGYASAGVTPSQFFVMNGAPKARWSSEDLETLLAGVDETAGLTVVTGTIQLPWKVRANGGSFATGSSHINLGRTVVSTTGANGVLLPVTLIANQNQIASMNLEGHLLAPTIAGVVDSFSPPAIYGGGVSLSAAAFTNTYRMHGVSLDGTAATGITGFTINFGIQTDPEYTDGGVFPRALYLPRAVQTVDIKFRDQTMLNTYGLLFNTATAAVFGLAQNAAGGNIVDPTSADHITITAGAGLYSLQQIGGQGFAIAEPTLRMHTISLTAAVGVALA